MKFSMKLIKDHPYATAATVVVAAYVAYVILSGSSKSTQVAVSSTGVDPQQQAIQGQLALQGQQMSGQLQALGIQAATQVQLKQLDLQGAASDAAYQYQIAQLQAGYQTQHDQLAAATQIAGFQSQLEAIQSQNQTIVQQAQIGSQSQIAAINASVQQAAVNAQQQIATQQAQSNAQIQIAQANANAAMYGAGQAAGAAKQASTMGTIATLGMAAMFMFCDVQIKTKMGCVDSLACLDAVKRLPLDRFVYLTDSAPGMLGDNREHLQTYAQDFYRVIGASDWNSRTRIDMMDMMGAILGSIKALENRA